MGSNDDHDVLPPPPALHDNVVPERIRDDNLLDASKKMSKPKRVSIARRSIGTKGRKVSLLANHFKVSVAKNDGHFFHYSVALLYEDGSPVDSKGIGRKIIEKVNETYRSELGGKDFAYDGEKSLFTIGSLPNNKMEFSVYLDTPSTRRSSSVDNRDEGDSKRMKRSFHSKTYKVEISFAAKIPINAIMAALRGQESENCQEAVRVLDIILRQHAARQGCLLVRQSFFNDDTRNYVELGGGVLGCRGFHSSFRATQSGLTLNMDGSTTTIIQPGPLVDFLIANQRVQDPVRINWDQAKRTLKNLRIKVSPTNQEYRITGLSEQRCIDQKFLLKRGPKDGDDSSEEIEITVADYFVKYRQIDLRYSRDLPCINVGKPKKPTYIPVELCSLLPLQRYTKALTVLQRSQLVEKSRQKPQEKKRILTDVMKTSNYNAEPMLRSCGINISGQFSQVEGRILPTPRLKVGSGDDLDPRNGRWNFNNKTFYQTAKIEKWVIVNFSARCDVKSLVRDLIRVGKMKGIPLSDPIHMFEEDRQFMRSAPHVRVAKMFEQMKRKLPEEPRFILCLLHDRKNSEVYGPWKRKTLVEIGIFNQCLSPSRVNEQYITNVLLKINAKLGGLNSVLAFEISRNLPLVSKVPTILFGIDVSHGSPGRSDIPSIAAVVGSRSWPSLSRYRACVRSQSPKVEMVDALFKPDGAKDNGIIRELLLEFYSSSGQMKPSQIMIFRDGVSESQFNQVLNFELDQIVEACKHLDEKWSPKITLIVAQKNHHTKFFLDDSQDNNVAPGTVIDTGVCHPTCYDFYMCAHAGMIGTTRPTHYHVLHDEIGFTTDELQDLIHSLSYVYQRSTTAISLVAPVRYAHLAASQYSQIMKFEDVSDQSSSHNSVTRTGQARVPDLPVLSSKVRSSMFFC